MSGRRTRRAKLAAAAFSYHEDSDDEDNTSAVNDDSDYDSSGGLLDILGFVRNVMRRVSGGRRRRPAPTPSKKTPAKKKRRAPIQGPCCGQAHCAANMFGRQNMDAAGSSSLGSRRRTKKKQCSKRSKATAPAPTVSLESDDEVELVDQKEKLVSKIDNFFKEVESSDEDFEMKFKKETKPETVTKNSDFYTISDDEDELKRASSREASFSQPNTSLMDSSLNVTQEKEKEKKKEDLFAFVDDLINNCDVQIEDLTKPESENRPVETLDDLKKKTEEILGTVSTLIEEINPENKKQEKKHNDSSEGPSCPVCFEPFGEDLPRMVTMCGHMFCEPCISQVAKTIKKCPTCRKSVTKQKYHAIYI